MKKCLMFAAVALAFASCSKMDGVTTQSEITKAKYDYAFKNYIGGEPAPDQTWGFSSNAYTTRSADFTRASVASPSVSEVGQTFNSFMAESYASAMELAANWVSKGWMSSINYDDSRYVVAKPWNNSGWTDRYYQINASVVPSNISAELQTAYREAVLAQVPEGQNNISKATSTGYSLTTKGGKVTVTPIYHNSNSNDKVSYYYYPAGSTPDVKSLPKYTIGQLGNSAAMLQSYSLVYVDGSGNVSYEFPANYVICFMVSNMSQSSSNVSVLTKGAGETDEVTKTYPAAYEYYADGNYNQEIHTVSGWNYTPTNTSHAATFSTSTISFVGFEDWNDMDYNDLIFAVGGTTGGGNITIPDDGDDDNKNGCDIRIIAEDLSAEGASDFDFNDVVLDVTYGSLAKVVLTHAGGVLPLCIRVNGNHDESLEVHKLFGQWVGDENETISVNTAKQKMINTGAGPSVGPVDISNKLNVSINSAEEANEKLQLWVFKEGSWQQMEAPQGEPACKLAVDDTFTVLPERTSIKGAYPLFVTWATTEGFKSKWW